MKKTLGGDRLGAGKKMEVELHNYGRSTHNLGYLFRTTMSAGTLVPFMSEVGLPGDTFDINLDAEILTHPTIGPLFGSYKVQLDVFQAPMRLYQAALHNNKLGIGMRMSEVKLPVIRLVAPYFDTDGTGAPNPPDLDNSQINPSCILPYLGLRGIGQRQFEVGNGIRDFNGIPLLAYWDIYKNYYANKQEEIGAVIHWDPTIIVENVVSVEIDGQSISEHPVSTNQPILGLYSYLEMVWAVGLTQPLEQVLIILNDDRVIPLSEFGTVTGPGSTADSVQILYDAGKWGVGPVVISWRYLTGAEIEQKEIDIFTFDLANIDTMRDQILAAPQNAAFDILGTALTPYKYLGDSGGDPTLKSIMSSQEGLGLKTYQSDIFNNWLSTEWIDGTNGISEITAVDTSGGSFTMDTLLLARKVYDMLNRIAVSGGSYDDWLDAVYTHDRYVRCESPMYMGGLIKELVFQEVISNSESLQSADAGSGTTVNQPLGTLAGRGVLSKKHKGGNITIRVDEPSYIMGIVSLTPRIDYSQGNKWDMHLKTMDDLHKPALDEIGFQELVTEQMAWWDTVQNGLNVWEQKSAGKQPAWLNYMTNHNRVYGNFAIPDNEMFMTLNRRYTPEVDGGWWTIGDLTTYVDPRKYNHIFAETAIDSQNFWTQISVDIIGRRKISARMMPNL